MSQSSLTPDAAHTATGLQYETEINNALAALASLMSGGSAPTSIVDCQFWADTTAGLLKMRNTANSAWITIGMLNAANLGLKALFATAPTVDSTIAALSTNASCTVYDDCLYVCEYSNNSIACYSIGHDRKTLALLSRLALAVGANPRGIQIRDGVAYVVNHGTSTLQVIDVTNKKGLTSISTTATATNPKDLCINGNDIYVFCNSGFVQKWTIDGKYLVTKRYSVSTVTTPLAGAVINDVLCVVGQNGKLEIFTLATLTSLSSLNVDTWLSFVEGRGTFAYAVDYSTAKLYKIDISNPSAPVVSTSASTSASPSTVRINGNYAYIPCLSSPGKLDVFNLNTLTKVFTIDTNTGQAGFLALDGPYAYVTGHIAPLTIDSINTGIEYKRDEYDQRMIDRGAGNFMRFNTPFKNVITKTAPYTVAIGDEYIRVGLGATITLPAASIVYAGMLVTVANVHATLSSPIAGGVVAWTIPARSAMSFICADDGTQWDLASGQPSFRGAKATKSVNQSLANNTQDNVTFPAEDFDTDSIHDVTTNNERLTVPAGVSFVRVMAQVMFANSSTGIRQVTLAKGASPISKTNVSASASGVTVCSVDSGPIAVVAGDYFKLTAYQDSGAALNIEWGIAGAPYTFLSMEILG